MIETERLLVRSMREDDVDDLFAVLSDPRVMKYIEPPFDRKKTAEFINDAGLISDPLVYAVELKAAHKVIGHMIWHPFDRCSYELGWIIGCDYWSKGYAGELTQVMLKKAEEMGKDVVIECHHEQAATKHIASKYGFVLERRCKDILLYRHSRENDFDKNNSMFQSTLNTRILMKGELRFIRSDVPDRLSTEETEWLANNNITTVIDLREDAERKRKVCPLESDGRFCYHSMPVTGGNRVPTSPDDVSASYAAMVDDQFEHIFDTAMSADSNVMFFCNAGKDRTGVLSAAILHEMGYTWEYIVSDYLKSAVNLRKMLEDYAESDPMVDINVITPQKRYIEEFLDWYENER